MVKAAIIVFFFGLLTVGSTQGRCPKSHPYTYLNGRYCCQSNREKVYRPDGSRCDGSKIQKDSSCCEGDRYTRCRYGNCENSLNPGQCPESHPYTYLYGRYCCESNMEKIYRPDGRRCDGSKIEKDSSCCEGERYTRCPSGNCENFIPECTCDEIDDDFFDLEDVVYDVDAATSIAEPPQNVGRKIIKNRSSLSQTTAYSVSRTVTETSSFSHQAGASVTVGTTFSVGVPFVAKGEISVSATASYSYTTGAENSEERTVKADFSCVGAAYKTTECDAIMYSDKINVPYTRTWVLKGDASCKCKDSGVFQKVAGHRLELEINEVENLKKKK